ncbi:MAG: hypothetical protein HRU03_03385 [Nanoarchaeales archaeon]|nr:hypothetical protein [Nanoarchaeales archaeon]
MSADDILGYGEVKSKILKYDGKQLRKPLNEIVFRFDGFNEEITSIYFWHIQFPYYVLKGYKSIKIEDLHYFSESSQFGSNMRQIKGGSIRAYQENFQQVVTLIRQHLLPLLKEIKEAHFYKIWFDKISKSDEIVCFELDKSSPNITRLNKYRGERNEAINHMKDQWVNVVEGGRMWQMNRSASEQGLDFALLPQLFFGINLDDPFQVRSTVTEQLKEDVYPIDVSLTAKEAVARNMYKFYTWLPTAIKDTEVTFKLKISALKNIYAQVQMYVEFMKPLLKEINAKSENFSKSDWYKGFESENAEMVNLIDSSYSTIDVIGIGGYERKGRTIAELEFNKYGLFLTSEDIHFGKYKGKTGFVSGMSGDDKYIFYPCDNKEITNKEYIKLRHKYKENPTPLHRDDLQRWNVMGTRFSQKRRNEILNTPQGPQPQPFMRNTINYFAASWNIYELASYRANFKIDSLKLMETFIDELSVVREDLLKYANYFEGMDEDFEDEFNMMNKSKKSKDKNTNSSGGSSLKDTANEIMSPIAGLGELFSVFLPKRKSGGSSSAVSSGHGHGDSDKKERDEAILKSEMTIIEDTWKVYSIFKKANGFIMY